MGEGKYAQTSLADRTQRLQELKLKERQLQLQERDDEAASFINQHFADKDVYSKLVGAEEADVQAYISAQREQVCKE